MPIDLRRWTFILLCLTVPSVAISISFFMISSCALMVLTLILMLRERDRRFFIDPLVALLGIYFLLNALSLTQTEYLQPSLRGLFRVFRHVLFCLSVVYALDSERKIRVLLQIFLVTAVVVGLDALIQGATGFEILRSRQATPYSESIRRLTGPFHHANDFSAYLSFTLFLFLGLLTGDKKNFSVKSVFFWSAGLLILLVCLLGTLARGAWVASILGCLFLALVRRRIVCIAALAVLLAAIAFLSPDFVKERARSLFNAKNSTVVERQALWAESYRMIAKSPYLGLGINTYAKNEPFFKEAGGNAVDNQYAHNGYLHIAAEIGIVGLLSFLAFFIFFFWRMFGLLRFCADPLLQAMGIGFLAGIFSFLIHSATDTNLQSILLVNTLWLAVGTVWAIGRRCRSTST